MRQRARANLNYVVPALLLLVGLGCSAQEPEILRPEAAFPYTVDADSERVSVQFAIPEGYYLYRNRFEFASATPGVTLESPRFPEGEVHEDEFFGVQEIYRGEFAIDLPYRTAAPADELLLELGLQGCADFGLCYPPQDWQATVALPTRPAGSGFSPRAGGFLPQSDAEPLPPEQAFVMNARFDAANELTVGWQIEPGYYLYRDKFEFAVDGEIGLGNAELPAGVAHTDQNFGDVEVYYEYVEAKIPFSRASADAMPVTVHASFQGCKEDSICYPPMERSMALTLPASNEFAGGSSAATDTAMQTEVFESEQDGLARLIRTGSMWAVLSTFFGAGLLLAFTPCVLPMVPILSSIITASGNVTPTRGFGLSLSYVMGMAVTYTVAGALAALSGAQIQAMFQHPVIISVFAALFIFLSLGMFGLFELQMPAAIQTRLSALANRQRGGTFVGVAVMGALSALIVTACVAPPLIAALTVIGQTGDVVRGSSALFAMSLGMGVPLLVVGASGGTLLPKAGAWMNVVKAAFGVMMIGVAIWMLDRILPGTVTLALWGALAFFTGVFLGAFDPLPEQSTPTRRLCKGLGVLSALYGAILLIGALLGGDDPLRPVPQAAFAGAHSTVAPAALEFREVETLTALESALMQARSAGQPVMIDFTADWCVSCREMEEYTFPDAAVIAALEPFMLLRADVTANNDDDKALLEYFRSYGPPTIAFFDAHGTEQDPYRLVGFVPPEKFADHVSRLASL
jgi:thiol:disulfide interchange protein DsbD